MSGFCVVVDFADEVVPPAVVHRMADIISYRGPDGAAFLTQDSAGFAYLAMHTTPESRSERQPHRDISGRLVVVADARLDNRAELVGALTEHGYLGKQMVTDVEVIAAAYQRWGRSCPRYLVGDFAFAIWDAPTRQLLAARDTMGIRQIYYAVDGSRVYLASSIRSIVLGLGRKPARNDQLIGEYLLGSTDLWICQTVYTGISRLPPAHTLHISAERLDTSLYYVLGEDRPPSGLKTEQDWSAALHTRLDGAVNACLRSATPVGISTGGGLDSSAMACVAYELAQREPSLPPIGLYATVFEATPSADESSYFTELATHCQGFAAVKIVSDDLWALKEFGSAGGFPLEEPELYPLRSHTLAVPRRARQDGCRVVMYGEGADGLLGYNVYWDPRGIRGVAWHEWWREAPYYCAHSGISLPKLIWAAYLRPWIPEPLIRSAKSVLRRETSPSLPWVTHKRDSLAVPRCALSDGFWGSPSLPSYSSSVYGPLRSGGNIARYSALDVTMAHAGCEWRLPYLDRRVIDLALHIPHELRAHDNVSRIVLRQAMQGTLPEAIRNRQSKITFDGLTHRGLRIRERAKIEGLLTESFAQELGYIDVGQLRKGFEQYWYGRDELNRSLVRALALETWLRSESEQV